MTPTEKIPLKFPFTEDPGHGWLRVPRKLLGKLGIAKDITSYSYQTHCGQFVWLEEDADLGTFLRAYIDRYDRQPVPVVKYTNRESRIRALPHYVPRQGGN